MLDPNLIRADPERIKAGALKKHFPDRAAAVDRFLALDAEMLALIPKIDALRSLQKAASRETGKVMQELTDEARANYLDRQRIVKTDLLALEERSRELEAERDAQLLLIPNVPDESVPEGKDDQFNVEIRTWGEVPTVDFPLRPHFELGEAQGWMDFSRA